MSSHSPTRGVGIGRWIALLIFIVQGVFVSLAAQAKAARTSPSPLSVARLQAAKGDLVGAEAEVWRILATDANNVEALSLLGSIRASQLRYGDSESLFRRVVELAPGRSSAHNDLGDAFLAQERVQEAVQQYELAQKLDQTAVGSKLGLARVYVSQKDFEAGLKELNSISARNFPKEAIPLKVAVLAGLGRKSEAAALTTQVKSSLPQTLTTAEVLLRAGLADETLSLLKGIQVPAGASALRFHFLDGQALLQKGQAQAASASFRKAFDLDPKSAAVLLGLAECAASLGQHGESVSFLRRASELEPDSIPVWRHLVVEAQAAGQGSVALDAARRLAEKSPDNLDDLHLVSTAMLQGHDSEAALAALKSYTVRHPDDPEGWLAFGIGNLTQKNYPVTRGALERAARLQPNQPAIEFQLGVLDSEESKMDDSIRHFERAVQLQPHHARAWGKLGSLYLQRGDLDKAQGALQKSEQSNPTDPDTQYKLAIVMGKMGRPEEARKHMQRLQELKQAAKAQTSDPKKTSP